MSGIRRKALETFPAMDWLCKLHWLGLFDSRQQAVVSQPTGEEEHFCPERAGAVCKRDKLPAFPHVHP
jgi:hypothetical protein